MVWIVLFVFLYILAYMWWEAHRNRIVHIELAFPQFPSSFRAFSIFLFPIFIGRYWRKKCEGSKKKGGYCPSWRGLYGKRSARCACQGKYSPFKNDWTGLFYLGNNDYEVEYDSSKEEDKEKMLV